METIERIHERWLEPVDNGGSEEDLTDEIIEEWLFDCQPSINGIVARRAEDALIEYFMETKDCYGLPVEQAEETSNEQMLEIIDKHGDTKDFYKFLEKRYENKILDWYDRQYSN
jgi:hypothetical protein